MSVTARISDLSIDAKHPRRPYRWYANRRQSGQKNTKIRVIKPETRAAYKARIEGLVEKLHYGRAAYILKSAPSVAKDLDLPANRLLYLLYRSGNWDLVEALAQKAGLLGQLVLAQASFRAGKLALTEKLLKMALPHVRSDNVYDVYVDIASVRAINAVIPDLSKVATASDAAAFDHSFISSYAYIQKCEWSTAERELQSAELGALDECDRAFVQIQRSYLRVSQHNTFNIADDTPQASNPYDGGLAQLHWANTHAGPHNTASALRALAALCRIVNSVDFDNGLTALQEATLTSSVLSLRSISGRRIMSAALKLAASHPTHLAPLVMAFCHNARSRVSTTKGFLKSLRRLAKSNNPASILALVQALIDAGLDAEAARTLLNFWEGSFKRGSQTPLLIPGFASLALDAALRLNKSPSAVIRGVLRPEIGDCSSLAAVLALSNNSSDREEAVEYFNAVEDPEIRASGLLVAGVGEYSELCSDLPTISDLIEGVDVEGLDDLGIPIMHTLNRAQTMQKKSNRKSGTKKMPQCYSADRKPDAERWLPKQDRSGYRSRRSRAVQGAVSEKEVLERHTPAPVIGAKGTRRNIVGKKKKGRR